MPQFARRFASFDAMRARCRRHAQLMLRDYASRR